MKKLKQILIVTHSSYLKVRTEFKKDTKGEELSLDDYVNTLCGNLFDEGHEVLEILPNFDQNQFVIVYNMTIDKKK